MENLYFFKMDKVKVLFLFFILFFNLNIFAASIKEADLSGSWYPADRGKLTSLIESYLNQAKVNLEKKEILGIISPHAGLSFSGPIAAYGFKALAGRKIEKVIVVGFSHKLDYDKIAVFDKAGYKTPLGVLYRNKNLSTQLVEFDSQLKYDSSPFDQENSVEMILPFIQVALGNPKIVLIAIGEQNWQNSEILGKALYAILKQKDNFAIVASTDLSHYLPKAQTEKVDRETAELIKEFNPKKLYKKCISKNKMCGTAAVAAVMLASKKLGADKSVILAQSNSAKISGRGSKAVGYLSAAFIRNKNKQKKENDFMSNLLNQEQQRKLINIARKTLDQYIKEDKKYLPKVEDNQLKKDMGAFVTLRKNGNLRGCIGNIIAKEPLYLGVRDMAIAAATEDPRFSPVNKGELEDINIEISVLSPLEKTNDPEKIVLGKHGVLVRKGFRSGVFLPQVADETGWSKEEFMNNLCGQKAGLSPNCWKTGDCDMYIFSAEVFEE